MSLPALSGSPQLTSGSETARAATGMFAVRAVTAPEAAIRAQAGLNTAILLRQASDEAQVAAVLEYAAGSAPRGTATDTSATYLLARELMPGQPSMVVKLLKPLAGDTGPLRPYIVAQYAAALGGAGDTSEAVKQWKRLLTFDAPPRALQEQAYRGLAGDADKPAERQAWLAKLVGLTGAAADRLLLAQAAKDAGDTATFKAQMHAIVTGDPGTYEAVLAVQALKAAKVAIDPGDEALVEYRHGDFSAVETLLSGAVDEPGATPAQRTFRLYYLAASYESEGKKDDAIATYDLAAMTGANSPFVHRARYWAAEVMATTGDAKDASARYAALVKDGPAGEFTGEAAFQAGYLLLQAGDAAAAVTTWESLGVSTDPRLLYWEGRAAEDASMTAAAKAAFEAAAKAGPFDFYGIEAQDALTGDRLRAGYRERNLKGDADWTAIGAWLVKTKGAGTIPGPATAAGSLAALGLRDDARQALLDAADGAEPWATLGLVREAREAGLYDASATLADQLVSELGVSAAEVPPAVVALQFPIDYVSSVEQAAKQNGLDPLFLAAVIYQESTWNPAAGSTAGAIGLMQLIGSTGAAVGAQVGIEGVTPADLQQPGLSIELGASFLGQQLKAFGDPALALAAYNAGPGNAARWQGEWDGVDAATLVATMDFSESASYVENIYEWYARYREAYATG